MPLKRIRKHYLNTLILETENAIRHLDVQLQNTFRHLAYRNIKQIAETDTCNALHKRHQYNLKQVDSILLRDNLTIAKADKGRTIVIIHKDMLNQKNRKLYTRK